MINLRSLKINATNPKTYKMAPHPISAQVNSTNFLPIKSFDFINEQILKSMGRNQPRGWKFWKFWELKKQTPTWCYIKLSSLIEIEFTPKPLLWGCIFCIKNANALVTNFALELPCPLL